MLSRLTVTVATSKTGPPHNESDQFHKQQNHQIVDLFFKFVEFFETMKVIKLNHF